MSLAFCIQGIKIAGWSYIYSYSFLDADAPLLVCTQRRPTLSAISDISKITLKTAPGNLQLFATSMNNTISSTSQQLYYKIQEHANQAFINVNYCIIFLLLLKSK